MRQRVTVKLIPRIDLQALANKLVCVITLSFLFSVCFSGIHMEWWVLLLFSFIIEVLLFLKIYIYSLSLINSILVTKSESNNCLVLFK